MKLVFCGNRFSCEVENLKSHFLRGRRLQVKIEGAHPRRVRPFDLKGILPFPIFRFPLLLKVCPLQSVAEQIASRRFASMRFTSFLWQRSQGKQSKNPGTIGHVIDLYSRIQRESMVYFASEIKFRSERVKAGAAPKMRHWKKPPREKKGLESG